MFSQAASDGVGFTPVRSQPKAAELRMIVTEQKVKLALKGLQFIDLHVVIADMAPCQRKLFVPIDNAQRFSLLLNKKRQLSVIS